MPDFFTEMASVAASLLAPSDQGGLGARAGTVTFVRYTAVPPAEPWLPPPEPIRTALEVRAQAFGVGKELIGLPVETGGAIVASDIRVVSEVIPGGWEPGTVIELDGKPVVVLSVKSVPAVGTVSAMIFIVRA